MKSQKGVALIWSLVICAILLIVAGTMASYIIKESRFSVQIEDSTKAYSGAKTGIEWAINHINNTGLANNSYRIRYNDVTVGISVSGTAPNQTIVSTGNSNNVRRRIEYQMSQGALTELDHTRYEFSNPGIGPLNNESFTLQFDFWGKALNYGQFGLDYSDPASSAVKLYARFYPPEGGIYLVAYSKNPTTGAITVTRSEDVIPISSLENETWKYRATLRYIKDTAAVLKIQERLDDNSYDCLGTTTIDLAGKNLGNLNSLWYYPSESGLSFQTGEETHAVLTTGTGTIYIDNVYFKK